MSEQNADPSEEALIDAALAALEQAPRPRTILPEPASPPAEVSRQEGPAGTPPATTGSPTLDALGEARRPRAKTVCAHCPNSVWFASAAEVKCYCRVMFLITWSSHEPSPITHCDGAFLGQA